MIYKEKSRRKFIRKCLFASSVFLGEALVLSSCGSGKPSQEDKKNASAGDPCDDLSAVSENEILKREKFGYVKESPIADNNCGNCGLYVPSEAEQACGKCMLFEGPVYSSAYCTYWAPQV